MRDSDLMRTVYLIFVISTIAIGSWLVGFLAELIYCHVALQDFIFKGANYGNNASEYAGEMAIWGLIFYVPSILFIQLPVLLILRNFLSEPRFPKLFILVALIPYALLVWFLLDWDFFWILVVASTVFTIASQSVLAAYGRQTAALGEQ